MAKESGGCHRGADSKMLTDLLHAKRRESIIICSSENSGGRMLGVRRDIRIQRGIPYRQFGFSRSDGDAPQLQMREKLRTSMATPPPLLVCTHHVAFLAGTVAMTPALWGS